MLIKDERKTSLVTLEQLKGGCCFASDDAYYMVISKDSIKCPRCTTPVVSLEDGAYYEFDDDTPIEPILCETHVRGITQG